MGVEEVVERIKLSLSTNLCQASFGSSISALNNKFGYLQNELLKIINLFTIFIMEIYQTTMLLKLLHKGCYHRSK